MTAAHSGSGSGSIPFTMAVTELATPVVFPDGSKHKDTIQKKLTEFSMTQGEPLREVIYPLNLKQTAAPRVTATTPHSTASENKAPEAALHLSDNSRPLLWQALRNKNIEVTLKIGGCYVIPKKPRTR